MVTIRAMGSLKEDIKYPGLNSFDMAEMAIYLLFVSGEFALSACKGLFQTVMGIRISGNRLARFTHSLAQYLTSLDPCERTYL